MAPGPCKSLGACHVRHVGAGIVRLQVPQTLKRFELWGACGDLNLPSLPTRDPPKPSATSSKRQRDTTVYPGSGHLVV